MFDFIRKIFKKKVKSTTKPVLSKITETREALKLIREQPKSEFKLWTYDKERNKIPLIKHS